MNSEAALQGGPASTASSCMTVAAAADRWPSSGPPGVYGPLYDALLAELAAGIYWGPAWRAIQLGTCPEVAEALLRGESVPLDRLDAAGVARYGRRSR
jgi:hypothetical protein